MNSINRTSRVLGVAFLLQFITSVADGIIKGSATIAKGSISEIMVNIADRAWLMRVNILFEMFTAAGIIFLGAILYIALRKYNENTALTAFGFYILEAVMLAASSIQGFSLLCISQEYISAGYPASLLTRGNMALESMNYIYNGLLMLAFCLGAILFYYLLYKSRVIPRALSLWGLITVFLCLIGVMFVIFGYKPPILLYIPYMPFEGAAAVWILVKGIKEHEPASRDAQLIN